MADKFTSADTDTLLSQPGFFYYRDYNTSNPYVKAVFANGAAFTPTTESVSIAFDDVGDVRDEVSNETVEIALSSGRVLDLDFIDALTGGLYAKTVNPGTPVAAASQTIASGDWVFDQIVLFEGQNSDLAAPSITSVTAGTDGVLAEGTDYNLVLLPEVGYGISIVDSANVTIEAQDIVIVYGYTPAGSTTLTRGGVKIITPIEIAFQTIGEDGNFVTYTFYKATSNGADGHGFSPENSAEPITMDLAFTAKKDTNRTSGDQLMSIVSGGASLG